MVARRARGMVIMKKEGIMRKWKGLKRPIVEVRLGLKVMGGRLGGGAWSGRLGLNERRWMGRARNLVFVKIEMVMPRSEIKFDEMVVDG